MRRSDAASGFGEHDGAIGTARGTLMLVDTDGDVAARLMDDAVEAGIDSTWCDDGAEALLALGVEQPDVLVLAARTSVVDAATITATVRGRWTLPILIGSPSAD
ncbi:two-component system response regulator, partial [Mycobacterium sp. ITM-2017-0098]